MTEDQENEGNYRPGESVREELQRLRCRVADLERGGECTQKELLPAQEQERFRLFYERSPLGYQSLNTDGRILDINPTWLRVLGYQRNKVVGRWFGDLLTPDSRRVFPRRFARFKEVGEVRDVRFEMICGDGRTRFVEFDGRISWTSEGHFDRTHCVLRDVTERRETEEAIRRNEARHRLFVETTNEGIWAMDADHKTTFVNARMVAMLGYVVEEMIGRVVEEFMFEEDLPAHRERMAARHEWKAARYEHRFRHKNGEEVWTLVSATALKSSQGRFEGSFALFADLTERKRAQRDAEQRQAGLLRMSRLITLGEMASGIAHELNQPLTAILSYGGACQRRMQAAAPDLSLITEYLGQIVSQGQRAGQIIRRMRSMAKGQQPHFVSASLEDIIRTALDMIRWELKQNEIPVCLDIAESLPPVHADPIQIEQVLLNLVRNSMDAMGGVPPEQRSLTVRAAVSDGDYLCVEVRDSGIGLPPKDPGCVFDSFFTTKKDGLGIGLSISRSIVEAHRGILDAKPNPGPGTTFFFRLPVHRPTGSQGDNAPEPENTC
jgi:PAS domain S-box-containing protein